MDMRKAIGNECAAAIQKYLVANILSLIDVPTLEGIGLQVLGKYYAYGIIHEDYSCRVELTELRDKDMFGLSGTSLKATVYPRFRLRGNDLLEPEEFTEGIKC